MSSLYLKNNGVWYVAYTDRDGQRRHKSTRTTNKKMAKLFQRNIDNELMDGQLLGFTPIRTDQMFLIFREKTLNDPDFTEGWKVCKISIIERLYRFFKNRIKFFHQIDAELIEEYQRERRLTVSPETVNKEITALKQMIRHGIVTSRYPNTPILMQIKRYKVPNKKVVTLKLNEIKSIIQWMKENQHSIQWMRIQFIAYTGIRKSEMNLIRWSDVNYTEKIINLVNHGKYRTKNQEDRILLITEPISEVLFKIKKMNKSLQNNVRWRKDYVFPELTIGAGGHLLNIFKNAQRALGIEPIRVIHDLRHSFSTIIQQEIGLNMFEAQHLLGHKSVEITNLYTHRDTIKLLPKLEKYFNDSHESKK